MKRRIALAIFVKTPGLSPVKTRLAATLGAQLATEFYNLSTTVTERVIQQVQKKVRNLTPYWAIAEIEGLASPRWKNFNRICQGQGTLGDRLSSVYNQLLTKYDLVAFIGSDSPHLSVDHLSNLFISASQMSASHFMLGESKDGGFYFFAGSSPLQKNQWLDVTYSSSETFNQLHTQLQKNGSVVKIEKSFDIDDLSDLKQLATDPLFLTNRIHLIPEQLQIIDWAKKHVSLY
jgi:hypothetical protein